MDPYRISILELVLIQTGCSSLDELFSLSGEVCINLAASFERLKVPIPLSDLNTLLACIADTSPESTEESAKAKLIRILREKGTNRVYSEGGY